MNRLNQVFDLNKYLNLPNIRLNKLSSNSKYVCLITTTIGRLIHFDLSSVRAMECASVRECVREYLLHFIILILMCTGLTHLGLDLYRITSPKQQSTVRHVAALGHITTTSSSPILDIGP